MYLPDSIDLEQETRELSRRWSWRHPTHLICICIDFLDMHLQCLVSITLYIVYHHPQPLFNQRVKNKFIFTETVTLGCMTCTNRLNIELNPTLQIKYYWHVTKELSTPARLILQLLTYVPGFTVLTTCNCAFGTLKPWSFETGVQGEFFG